LLMSLIWICIPRTNTKRNITTAKVMTFITNLSLGAWQSCPGVLSRQLKPLSFRKVFSPPRLLRFQESIDLFAQLANLELYCQNHYQKKQDNYQKKDVHDQTSSKINNGLTLPVTILSLGVR
jgi:hypothetical protein